MLLLFSLYPGTDQTKFAIKIFTRIWLSDSIPTPLPPIFFAFTSRYGVVYHFSKMYVHVFVYMKYLYFILEDFFVAYGFLFSVFLSVLLLGFGVNMVNNTLTRPSGVTGTSVDVVEQLWMWVVSRAWKLWWVWYYVFVLLPFFPCFQVPYTN